MKRRDIIGLAAGLVLAPTVALSQGLADRIVTELQRQGFTEIRTGTTLLGRGRIVATGPDGQREIIFNPRTGEILRDLWQARRSGSQASLLGSGGSSGNDSSGSGSGGSGSGGSGSGGSGSGGSGNDSDDDADDDSDDSGGDDNSGSGGDDNDDDKR
ncbi:MAG: hypothetical protein MUF73_03780 [Rhodobacteraceae bacterium]|jgi:hypothetical protein|nr:hypothetical protein [Paracoccaceae bacterium]